MSVELTKDELKLFEDNGITKDNILSTVNKYRNDGLQDDEIQKRIYNKLNSFNTVETTSKRNNGIDLTPSGIAKKASVAISTPIRQLRYGEKKDEARTNAQLLIDNAFKNNKIVHDLGVATDITSYFVLPQATVLKGTGLGAKALNLGLTGAYQGGLAGGLESLKQNGDLSGVGSGIGIGGAFGAGLPVAGKLALETIKLAPKTGGLLAKTVGRIKPETLKRAVQPNSIALDLSKDEAENLLMNTTERLRNNYADLLTKRGQAVADEANKLRNLENRVNLNDLENDIYSTFDQYNGDRINPARNMIGGLEDDLIDLVNSGTDDLNRVYNNYYPFNGTTNLRTEYNTIFDDLMKNARNKESFLEAQDKINILSKKLPEEMQEAFLDKATEDLKKVYFAKNTISPIDLLKAKQQIGKMATWSDETARQYKNPILEQIYGKFNNRLNELSPELKRANNRFSQIKNFEKNEGLRRILRQGDNIDSASSALKNYNSTVTKGNTNRNIQDLERIFVNEGYEPFLNNIDDVNAAMDLTNIRTTGDSEKANIAAQLFVPALKGVRKLNQKGVPQKAKIAKDWTGDKIQRILPANSARMPVLYGYVDYDEYR